MKEEYYYKWYLCYLDNKLKRGLLSSGEVEVAKITERLYELYKRDIETVKVFRDRQEILYKEYKRLRIINEIMENKN